MMGMRKSADINPWNSMQKSSALRESMVVIPGGSSPAAVPASGTQPLQQAEKCCAYNLTRGRFLSTDVESADFPNVVLSARLPLLTPESNAGLWLVPFRGISPMNVRVPIDLIYLDHKCDVLDVVELFPVSNTSPSGAPAASVLAVPAHTISTTETRRGDRLTFCAPAEIARRLLRNPESETGTQAKEGAAPDDGESEPKPAGKLFPWLDGSLSSSAGETPSREATPAAPDPQPGADFLPPTQKKTKASKSWLQRWLNPDPRDPRKAPREALTWLAACYFTGGVSKAQPVRDISPTGVFILTEERWYLGTIIRITLTDRRPAAMELSITVNAKAVRWGNDGVGLKFVFGDENGPHRDIVMGGSSRLEMEQFLQRVRIVTD